LGSVFILNSLRHLCVLGVSAVSVFDSIIHRRDAEVAETTQRKTEITTPPMVDFAWKTKASRELAENHLARGRPERTTNLLERKLDSQL
jgi:hypothetical protein